jgi:NAD(P)-dependent dehydrogenase (short-subunit alcohol dehydrogenase family)
MTTKIAVVTGASRSMGRCIALHLAKKGIDVILTYTSNKTAAEQVVAEIESDKRKAVALQLDISQSHTFSHFADEVNAALKAKWRCERFHFLVNNAGIGISAPLDKTSEQQFDDLMNIQLKGPFFLTQKLLPLIHDGGRIINFSSGLTRFTLPGYGGYAAMKGAIEVLTRYQAKELGVRGITVNSIAPGAIEADFDGDVDGDREQINQFIASQTALGRMGKPHDIGDVVAMLLSDESHWINAQRIEASGGVFI